MAAHMATMQSPSAPTSTLNRTNVLKRVRYDDYQIWRIIPSTLAQLEFLKEYKESDEHENVLWLKGPAMRFFHGFFFKNSFQLASIFSKFNFYNHTEAQMIFSFRQT